MRHHAASFAIVMALGGFATAAHAGATGNGWSQSANPTAQAAQEYNGELNAAKTCEARGVQSAYCRSIKAKHQEWYDADGTLKSDLRPR
ncbi:MAG: hypothetical protein ACRED8_04440 [Caulobacteraceae bacterium]